jgi:hypothetical protein
MSNLISKMEAYRKPIALNLISFHYGLRYEFFELLNCHILLYFYYTLLCTTCQDFWYKFFKKF